MTKSVTLGWTVAVLAAAALVAPVAAPAAQLALTSRPIASVLRDPLPSEELQLSETGAELVITGPTFTYKVSGASGSITSIRAERDGEALITSDSPLDLELDTYRLSSPQNPTRVAVQSQTKGQVVLHAQGVMRDSTGKSPEIDYDLVHTFFNDGVVVSAIKLTPRADLQVAHALVYRLNAQGRFSHYLHKRRDENGDTSARGALPEPGKGVRLSTLTSCLQVFSPQAALALFTDARALHVGEPNLDTAVIEVTARDNAKAALALSQYLLHPSPGKPYVLKAKEPFTFRVGVSVAPCRKPQARQHDLRMFTWAGDAKFPYPTDEEIRRVAQLGFTLFQMHRVGTPGEPRPPAGELERVIRKVHELGMLFLWEENADLLYAHAPGVAQMKEKNQWSLWQGFNYGGRYRASMDPFCDTLATCLASPNGLADYRVANLQRMFDRFEVDGLYLDDNLPYANCTLWREHGHPQPVYDCLIELHEMNWRRRELMRQRCPHVVLISHNTRAFILPAVCDFDALLYGEGYSFGSLEDYWSQYGFARSIPAQGMIWPGDDEDTRCPARLVYNYDLLTGGGQYTQLDWRLFSKKFPYAKGVTDREFAYTRWYNLAQYYFGLYESRFYSFADSKQIFTTTKPKTYCSVFRNEVWRDWLFALANMNSQPERTSLQLGSLNALGLHPEADYELLNLQERVAKRVRGDTFRQSLSNLTIPGQSLALYLLRQIQRDAPVHLWGGRRLSEVLDPKHHKLTLTIQGPVGLVDTVFLSAGKHPIRQVLVSGKATPFYRDSAKGLVFGEVTFTHDPLVLEIIYLDSEAEPLLEKPAPSGFLPE